MTILSEKQFVATAVMQMRNTGRIFTMIVSDEKCELYVGANMAFVQNDGRAKMNMRESVRLNCFYAQAAAKCFFAQLITEG